MLLAFRGDSRGFGRGVCFERFASPRFFDLLASFFLSVSAVLNAVRGAIRSLPALCS